MTDNKYVYAVGRRKTATAQVRLFRGKGTHMINGKPFDAYIHRPDLAEVMLSPFKLSGEKDGFYVVVKVEGSGESAQVQAIRLGIARALVEDNGSLRVTLKKEWFLTRDARKVERTRPGCPNKARKKKQWSKR